MNAQGLRTTIFTLASGVECECTEFGGKHQKILTQQKNKTMEENLIELITDVVVRVGDETNIDEKFIKKMLSVDRKQILVQARQFAHDFEEKFKFSYDYVSVATNSKEKFELEIDLKGGVFNFVPTKEQFNTYAEVLANKDVTVTMPKTGKEIRFTMLDYEGEKIGSVTKKSERSSHTALLMRNPCYREGEMWIKVTERELDNPAFFPLKDIEYLRAQIKENEGRVDTEIRFDHPEADRLQSNKREVVVDLLGQIAFFFPSEAI